MAREIKLICKTTYTYSVLLLTGYLGYYDGDNCLYVADRVKDIINYKTHKVGLHVFNAIYLITEDCPAITICLPIVSKGKIAKHTRDCSR